MEQIQGKKQDYYYDDDDRQEQDRRNGTKSKNTESETRKVSVDMNKGKCRHEQVHLLLLATGDNCDKTFTGTYKN